MELDQKVISKLKMLSEHDALLAIDEIAGVERSTIRNFPSYFMGILNRYMRGVEAQKSKQDRKRGDRGFKRDDVRSFLVSSIDIFLIFCIFFSKRQLFFLCKGSRL